MIRMTFRGFRDPSFSHVRVRRQHHFFSKELAFDVWSCTLVCATPAEVHFVSKSKNVPTACFLPGVLS